MKTWVLIDHDGESRDLWDAREMTMAEAFHFAERTGGKLEGVRVWLHRDVLNGHHEAAVGTEEEVEEIWPDGAVLAEPRRDLDGHA